MQAGRQKGRYIMSKYGKASGDAVKKEMHRYAEGTAKSGKGGKVIKSRKQAIAIGLSKARKNGAKVPGRNKS